MSQYYRFATHAQVLAVHPAYQFDAVVDADGNRARLAADRWGAPIATTDVRDLADRCQPEVAVLAIPPPGRGDVIRQLPTLRAVLVEKPLGRSVAEAEEFLALCAQHGVEVQVNLWRRADEAFRRLAEGGLHSLIGQVQSVTCVYGNGVMNNGIHMVDFTRMLVGEFATVQGVRADDHQVPMPEGDPDVFFVARMAGGSNAAFHPLSFEHYRENALDIWGTRGRVSIVLEGLYIVAAPRRPSRAAEGEYEVSADDPAVISSTVGEAFFHLYSNLADALATGSPLWSGGASALASTRVVAAVLASVESGGSRIPVLP